MSDWSAMVEIFVNHTLPKMSPDSAVLPTARVVGDALVVAYHLPGCDDSAVIQFNGVQEWAYGYPNDEGLHEHPLWGKGLTFYEFHEIPARAGEDMQWIGTFHDGTLTVRAQSVEVVAEHLVGEPRVAIDTRYGPGTNLVLDETKRRASTCLPFLGWLVRKITRLFGAHD